MMWILLFIGSINCEIISTSLGKLEGKQIDEFHLFKKIPFAKPPLGNLRFQKPEKPEKWEGVLNATEYGPACLSNSSVTHSPQKWIDEDCLHLNIFTSDYCLKSENCGVAVFVHGGSILYDSAVMFNDSFILETFPDNDVILVIPAYRLGIFSHFIVEDQSVSPTNLAIYDILQALTFVNKEIKHFGGDNRKITLMGHSIGASITSIMALSTEINQDMRLFQQTIIMSIAPQVFQDLQFQINNTQNFIKHANCSANSSWSQNEQDLFAMKCLQKMDAFELLRVQRSLEDAGYPDFSLLSIREPLFQEVSIAHFGDKPKKYPTLVGCTLKELDKNQDEFRISQYLNFENFDEVELKYRRDREENSYYFGNHTDKTIAIFVITQLAVQRMLEHGYPIYLYQNTYPNHPYHSDYLYYLLGTHMFEMDENELEIRKVFRKIITNFVKFGEPREGFEPANLENSTFFNIGETSGMKSGFEKKVVDYWFKEMVDYDKQVSALKNKKDGNLSFLTVSFLLFVICFM